MNITKCNNGHFFDADKYKVCPHCGTAVHKEVSNEKPEKSGMVMGMMKPPEPILQGSIIANDKFISEDPINEQKTKECIHEFIIAEELTGSTVYICKKCAAKKVVSVLPSL